MSKKQIIMDLLRAHPRGLFGLEIVRLSQGEIGRGGVYVHLAALEDQGLVEHEDIPQPPPLKLPRRRYRLTRKGLRVQAEDIDGVSA